MSDIPFAPTDCTPALVAAMRVGGTIQLAVGDYLLASDPGGLMFGVGPRIVGAGLGATRLHCRAGLTLSGKGAGLADLSLVADASLDALLTIGQQQFSPADKGMYAAVERVCLSGAFKRGVRGRAMTYSRFSQVIVQGSGLGSTQVGIDFESCVNCVIDGASVLRDLGVGLYLSPDTSLGANNQGIMIAQSVIFFCPQAIWSGSGAYLSVMGCVLDYIRQFGLHVDNQLSAAIVGNWIALTGPGDQSQSGWQFYNSSEISVSDNTVFTYGAPGNSGAGGGFINCQNSGELGNRIVGTNFGVADMNSRDLTVIGNSTRAVTSPVPDSATGSQVGLNASE